MPNKSPALLLLYLTAGGNYLDLQYSTPYRWPTCNMGSERTLDTTQAEHPYEQRRHGRIDDDELRVLA